MSFIETLFGKNKGRFKRVRENFQEPEYVVLPDRGVVISHLDYFESVLLRLLVTTPATIARLEKEIVRETGVKPAYIVTRTFGGQPVFVPIEEEVRDAFETSTSVTSDRSEIQEAAVPAVGHTTTGRNEHRLHRALKTLANRAFSAEEMTKKIAQISETFATAMKDWKQRLLAGEEIELADATLDIFSKIAADLVVGQAVPASLAEDLKWLYHSNVPRAIMNDKTKWKVGKIRGSLFKRANETIEGFHKLTQDRFKTYVMSETPQSPMDQYIELYIRGEFIIDQDIQKLPSAERALIEARWDEELRQKKAEWKKILDSGDEKMISSLYQEIEPALRLASRESRGVYSAALDTSALQATAGFTMLHQIRDGIRSKNARLTIAENNTYYKKIIEEVTSFKGDISTLSYWEILAQFPYLYSFFHEVLRLFPALPVKYREVTEGGTITLDEDTTIELTEGTLVYPAQLIHENRHNEFNPQRMIKKTMEEIAKYRAGTYAGKVRGVQRDLAQSAADHRSFSIKDGHPCAGRQAAVIEGIILLFHMVKLEQDINTTLKHKKYVDPTGAPHSTVGKTAEGVYLTTR